MKTLVALVVAGTVLVALAVVGGLVPTTSYVGLAVGGGDTIDGPVVEIDGDGAGPNFWVYATFSDDEYPKAVLIEEYVFGLWAEATPFTPDFN